MSQEEDFDEEEDEDFSVVMDNGSLMTKVGFSGDDAPNHIFETAIGSKIIDDKNKSYIGKQLDKHKRDKDITLKYPLIDGICIDFDCLEKIWHHIFYNVLKIVPDEMNILLTEPSLNTTTNREKCTQILFETFNSPAMYIGIQAVLALYASGRTTGLVIDSGYTMTELVPIYEGYALPHAISKVRYGGKTVTQYLKKLLLENNHGLDVHFDDFRLMKEQFGYIAVDPKQEMKKPICEQPKYIISGYLRSIDDMYRDYTSLEIENQCASYCGNLDDFMITKKEYTLPDGNIINLRHEQYKCGELLFDPLLIGIEDTGIGKKVVDSNCKVDVDIKRNLLENIVLCGGNTMFKGFNCRLEKEIHAELPYHAKIKITAQPERKYSQWIGGSILSSLSTFPQMWITKNEYDSSGPGIVHRKCF